MTPFRLIAALLTCWMLCVDTLLLVHIVRDEATWPSLSAVGLLGLLLMQLGLLAAWVVFGKANVVVRVGCFLLLQIVLSRLGMWLTDGRVDSWSLAVGLYAASLLLLAAAWKACQFLLHRSSPPAAPARDARWQFDLWQLLSLTTALSLLLGFWSQSSLNWQVAFPALLCFGFLAIVFSASLWVGLRTPPAIQIAALLVTCWGAHSWYQNLDFAEAQSSLFVGLVLILQMATLLAAGVLRVAGLKVARQHRGITSRSV